MDAVEAGTQLFVACLNNQSAQVDALLQAEAPLWYQEPDSEWTCLHLAAERNDLDRISKFLEAGAIWNSVDACGFTAADVALSLNHADAFRLVKDAGVRSEFLLRVLEKKDIQLDSLILKSSDQGILGSNDAFLRTRLRYVKDESGQEICLAKTDEGEEVGVMMGWEKSIMEATAKQVAEQLGPRDEMRVLNIGFGLGLIDIELQNTLHPTSHIIIEPHPDVLAHMKEQGWYDKPGVTVLEGRWQDHIESETIMADGFDFVYTDTFSEQYGDLVAFYEHIPNLLRDETSIFSFFNGLGATNATFATVYSDLAELHLSEVGLETTWSELPIVIDRQKSGIWGGTIVYFDLPYYRLPIAKMKLF